MLVAVRGPPFVAEGTFGDLYRADWINLGHLLCGDLLLGFAFVHTVALSTPLSKADRNIQF